MACRVKGDKRGIYVWYSKTKAKAYVGQSEGMIARCRQHKNDLSKGYHYNQHWQRHVNKYGLNDLEFYFVHECNYTENLTYHEQSVIDNLTTLGFELFNTQIAAPSNPVTAEKLELQRQNTLRLWQDPNYRERQVKAHTGYKPSRDHIDKIVASRAKTWAERPDLLERCSELSKQKLQRQWHKDKLDAAAIAATSKRVQIWLDNELIGEFKSLAEAARSSKVASQSTISAWAAGARVSPKGYTAKYV